MRKTGMIKGSLHVVNICIVENNVSVCYITLRMTVQNATIINADKLLKNAPIYTVGALVYFSDLRDLSVHCVHSQHKIGHNRHQVLYHPD